MNPHLRNEILSAMLGILQLVLGFYLIKWLSPALFHSLSPYLPSSDLGLFLLCLICGMGLGTLIYYLLTLLNRKFFAWIFKSSDLPSQDSDRLEFRPAYFWMTILEMAAIVSVPFFFQYISVRTMVFTFALVLIIILGQIPVMRNHYIIENGVLSIREYNVFGLETSLDIPLSLIERVTISRSLSRPQVVIYVKSHPLYLKPSNCMRDLYRALVERIG